MLEIEFSSGRIYQFEGVPLSVYQWLLRTPSKGGFVTRMINSRYPYRDVTRAVVTPSQDDLVKVLSDSVRRLEDKPRK